MRRKIYLELYCEFFVKQQPELASLPPIAQLAAAVAQESEVLGKIKWDPKTGEFQYPVARFYNEKTGQRFERSLELETRQATVMHRFVKEYFHDRAKVYQIAAGFGRALAKTDLDLPVASIPLHLGKAYCFECPDDLVFRTEPAREAIPDIFHMEVKKGEVDYHRTMIMAVVRGAAGVGGSFQSDQFGDDDGIRLTEADKPGILFLAPDYTAKGDYNQRSSYVFMPLPWGLTVREAIDLFMEKGAGSTHVISPEFLEYAMKALTYVESGDPDLHAEPGVFSTSAKEKKRRQVARDNCPFDTEVVGYGFFQRHYTKDKTWVDAYLRRQWYGPGRTLFKYVWIHGHERHFDTSDKIPKKEA